VEVDAPERLSVELAKVPQPEVTEASAVPPIGVPVQPVGGVNVKVSPVAGNKVGLFETVTPVDAPAVVTAQPVELVRDRKFVVRLPFRPTFTKPVEGQGDGP
jgi:hypothetical protein